MNLKDIFGQAEDGVMTYDQFTAACKEAGIKLADLSSGDYVSKRKFDDELAAKDNEISTLNTTISQRDDDLKSLQTKLSEAGNDVEKLNQLSNDFTSLQNKYNQDIEDYQAKLKQQAYEFAVKDFASSKRFTSNAAKRDFINSMISKQLQMDGDKILGADDFVSSYSQDNEDAFYVEQDPEPTPSSDPKPQFVNPTPGESDPGSENGFKFNFTGVRLHE